MTQETLGQDLGRLFEVGFNIGILAYIEQNQLSNRFGEQYRQDLQKLSFTKILRRLVDKEKVINENHRNIVKKWSIFFLLKGFLAGLNLLGEYIKSTGWNKRQLRNLEIIYYQCCFSDNNSIGTNTKDKEQAFKDTLSQFDNVNVDIGKYSQTGEFLNADTLMLLRCGNQLRVLCIDLSVFSIKSIRDLLDLNSIEVLRCILLSEISYIKSKSVFSNLALDTKNSGVNFSENLARYFTAFKRQDKESVKLIQAASYSHSFYNFLHSQALITEETPVVFNIVGYSDRAINAMSISRDNLDVLATCSHIYKHKSTKEDIAETREQVLNLVKRNAARSFDNGKDFIKRLLEASEDGINSINHTEYLKSFFNSIDIIPAHLAASLQVKPNSSLRDAHAELIKKALLSDDTYIFLTGNPGIGKTTAIVDFLKSQTCMNEGFLLFYVSPRKQVNLDIIDKFAVPDKNLLCDDKLFTLNTNADLIKKNSGNCTVSYQSNLYQDDFTEQTVRFLKQGLESERQEFTLNSKKRITEDQIQDISQINRGVLDSICEGIYTIINRQISNNIVATVSIQSLKKTQGGRDTLYHFEKIFKDAFNNTQGAVIPDKMRKISSRIKHLFIMIDEITGDDSGVEFLNGIHRILKNYQLTNSQYGFNTKVIVADASIVDGDIIKQHLSETSAEPNKIFCRKAATEVLPLSLQKFNFKGLNAVTINANSYPAKSLKITYKLLIESLQYNDDLFKRRERHLRNSVQNQIVKDINFYLDNPDTGQIIVYIQNKQKLVELIDIIKNKRKNFQYHDDYLEIHASLSEQDKQSINKYKNQVKVIFMTASASRGLSFPKVKHILVDIPQFEIEKNLMEIIQVIYRGRGDKILDTQEKELIFYLSEQTIYYGDDPQLSLQESKLNILNILLILKTAIVTRIIGYGQIGHNNFVIIPIGGKSVLAAGQTFSSKMEMLIKQLKKEYQKRRTDKLLQDVCTNLEELFRSAEILLRDTPNSEDTQNISYLSLRESLSNQFLKLANNGFDNLLYFTPIETGYINGSLLVVPIADKEVKESYKIPLGQEIITCERSELLEKMYEISRSKKYPESLHSVMNEAIDLVNLLREKPNKTQRFEENTQYLDRYYALPLFAFISCEAMIQYFSSNNEEPEDQRFRDILATYIQSVYPVANILPIGHKYRDFPFILFRSYSLNEMRNKIFTDKYLLSSNELNVLNIILSKEN